MSLTRRELFSSFVHGPRISPPAVTPAARFFRQYTHATPRINTDFWSFSIGGQVRHPLSLSYSDVLALPAIDLPCTLACAANRPGGERIGHAVWRGVPLALLLEQMDAAPNATHARLEAAGHGRSVVTLEALRGGLLAYAMNGATLAPEHGFPARLILPGLYDHKQPRWIERIELWDSPGAGGLWERRGWTASAVQTTAAFDAPHRLSAEIGPVALSGYAFAGARRITAVEVSVDGGAWMPVTLGESHPNVWTRWQTEWPAPGPGDYQLRVRAIDENGFVQSGEASPAYPHGSSGIHAITLHITGGRNR